MIVCTDSFLPTTTGRQLTCLVDWEAVALTLTLTLPRTMTPLYVLALLIGVATAAPESLYEDQAELAEAEGRFLYFNSSSTATSLTLLGAVILLGVIFYLVYVGGLLAPVGGSQYNRFGQDYGGGGYGYQGQARYMPRHYFNDFGTRVNADQVHHHSLTTSM